MKNLDKEEFRVKLEEINHLVEQKDYKGAMNVVDSIDWRRVKNVRTLCVVGEIYAANKRYEDSKEIFLLAYHRKKLHPEAWCHCLRVPIIVCRQVALIHILTFQLMEYHVLSIMYIRLKKIHLCQEVVNIHIQQVHRLRFI